MKLSKTVSESTPRPQKSPEKLSSKQIARLEENRQYLKAQLFAQSFKLDKSPFSLPEFVGITRWEALTCLGFHPSFAQLEAVVEIRRTSGYSGDLCSAGSTEYVRFFIDWRDGLGFQDLGLTSFQAYDVASPEPIQHLVSFELDEESRRRCCQTPVLPRVRAVLGWNEVPSLDPDALPVYGNSLDADIQVAPDRSADCVADSLDLDLSAVALSPELELQLAEAATQPVSFKELLEKYSEQKVSAARMTYPSLRPLLDPSSASIKTPWHPNLGQLPELDIDLGSVLEDIAADGKGDTTYEELVCAGLDSDRDTLGAVLHIKRRAGYSGGLCSPGSTEFVRFWADWNDDGTFTDLGFTSVQVHDIAELPDGGLYYAVRLPVDLSERVAACEDPQVIPMRAVLSWERPPQRPDQLERWGNAVDFRVRLRPHLAGDDPLRAEIYRIGGVLTENIDPTSHFAYPSTGLLRADDCSRAATDRPFAGNVKVAGRIRDFSGNGDPIYYQVQFARVTPAAPTWAPVTHQVTYHLDFPSPMPDRTVTVHSADGWFEYQEKLNLGPNSVYVKGELLATWPTRGLQDGEYDLRVAFTKDPSGVVHTTAPVRIIIDNTRFVVSEIVGASAVDPASTLDLVVDGANDECRRYVQGEQIAGHLRALDRHFFRWSLSLQPSGRTNGTQADPRCRSYTSLADNGDADRRWTIDTDDLEPCGYTLRLVGSGRAIVDSSGGISHWRDKYVGLVVDAP